VGLRIGGVPGFDDEQKGGRGTRTIMENEKENENENESENENEAGRVGNLTYFSFFRASAAGLNAGSSFTAAS
jgi:hypothetical protein